MYSGSNSQAERTATMTYQRILKKTGKILLYSLLLLLLLLCAGLLFIHTSYGKKIVKNQVQSYLRKKLNTTVNIGEIDYRLPQWIEIKQLYLEDRRKDTLLYGANVYVDLDMIGLIRGKIDIEKVSLKNIQANLYRNRSDSFFNYQFIIDAFSSPSTGDPATKDTARMNISLKNCLFENIRCRYRDDVTGSDFMATIQNFDAKLKTFQPDRLAFDIDDFSLHGVDVSIRKNQGTNFIQENNSPETITAPSPFGLNIRAGNTYLRDIRVLFQDSISGLHYGNNITRLSAASLFFDAKNFTGSATSLGLDSSVIVFKQPLRINAVQQMVDTPGEKNNWAFNVDQLHIGNTNFQYDDPNSQPAAGIDFAHLDLTSIHTEASAINYTASKTAALIKQLSFSDKSGFRIDTTHAQLIYSDTLLSASELYVKTNGSVLQQSFKLRYDSIAGIAKNPERSLLDAVFSNAVISFDDLYLLAPAMEKSLPKKSFAGQFLKINTELHGSLQRLNLPYFSLSGLGGSSIRARGILYNLADADRFSYDLFIDQSQFYKKDLLKFIPPENQASLEKLPEVFSLKGRFTGNKNDLVADINTSATGIQFAGRLTLKDLSNPDKLSYGLDIAQASADKNTISGFLPPDLLTRIELPANISASGRFKGNKNSIDTDLKIGSSYGPLSVKGFIKNLQDSINMQYDLQLSTPGFEIGTLIKQDSVLGSVSGNFIAKGTGTDYKTMRSSIIADIDALDYNNYRYRNANIAADFNNGIINSKGSINDSNLVLTYQIDADVQQAYPVVNGFVDVDTARLQPLHLYDDTLNFSVKTIFKSADLRPRHLQASLLMDTLRMQLGKKYFTLDTTSLVATSANGIDSIILTSPLADLQAGGAFDYDKVASAIMQHVQKFYKIPGYRADSIITNDQQIAFKGEVKNSPVIKAFIPDLVGMENISFEGSFVSAESDSALRVNIDVPMLQYGPNRISKANATVGTDGDRIKYNLVFDTLHTSATTLYSTNINGSLAHDSIALGARTKDIKGKDWFGFAGSLFNDNEVYYFRLKDSLLLNYEDWNVATDNYISYSRDGILVNNFMLQSDTAKIYINSREKTINSPVDIAIDNFNLKSISSLISGDTLFASGILDAKMMMTDFSKDIPAFTGDFVIENMELMQNPVGTISGFAEKESENSIKGTLKVTGNKNDIIASGNYYLNDAEKQFEADVDIRNLNMATLQGLSMNKLRNARGALRGSIHLDGEFEEPHWEGALDFDSAAFTMTDYGAAYLIDKQHIKLQYPDIVFNKFTIQDSLKHTLVLDGKISSISLQEYDLNLDINARDFIVLNTPRTINNQLFGKASMDANISITGNSARPDIEGNITLDDKSDITIVLPERNFSKDEGLSIVRFIDRDTFVINPPVVAFVPGKEVRPGFAEFLNYNLNIDVTKNASLTIVIDPVTGDEIKVQGDAQLNAGVDPGGNLVLAGNYELDDGYYVFNYQFLQRKFKLRQGSSIAFGGAPMNAAVNITAEYIVSTSARDLLNNEVSSVDAGMANSFNQKIPFQVVLYLTGTISKPIIRFDLQMPAENSAMSSELRTTIENKLAQLRGDEAATNKQVFALLLLGRFVGEESSDFFKGNSNDFNDLARQSVSQFLSSALNEIAGNLFKGIDIDLNLNSYRDYNSSGGNQQRTDLNLAVSKSFMNDRIVVSVGTNIGIEGQDPGAKPGQKANAFSPDVSLSYKITPDGKYMIKGYRKNQFEVVLDGYVVENGIAFIVTMDYDKFNELFRRKKK